MVLPKLPDSIYVKLLGHTPQATTAIVWIKEMAPAEVHTDEYERFPILEGTCTINISDKKYDLKKQAIILKFRFMKITTLLLHRTFPQSDTATCRGLSFLNCKSICSCRCHIRQTELMEGPFSLIPQIGADIIYFEKPVYLP